MNWEAISAIGQVLGALVVIVTLFYLAAQVRQGNRLAKLQARQRMIEQAQSELYAQMADTSISYSNIKEGPLTEEEQAKLSLFLVTFMRQREWEWFQYKDGVIDESTYKSYQEVINIHLGTPRSRKWWRVLGRFAFNADFVADVDHLLAKAEPSTYLQDMRTWDSALRFAAVTPRLPTIDVEAALNFYCEKLGFQLGWKWGDPVTHANVCRDAISLDLIFCPPDAGPALAYIQLAGVDAYYAELKQRDVDIGVIGDRPYRMRDFEIVDPNGNRLAFGQPI